MRGYGLRRLLKCDTQFRVSAIMILFAFAFGPQVAVAQEGAPAGIERGRQLYRQGLTASGDAFGCTTGNGIALSGAQISCVNCHRPSGFGSSEGGKYVPPITGPLLFAPRELNRNRIFYKMFKEAQPAQFAARLREPKMRPAYTPATLSRAIREGMDSSGQKLESEMPRCDLQSSDMENLVAYLKTLSVAYDPGVDSETVHLATVVSDGADPRRREAVLQTVHAFFDWMNTRAEGHRSRPNFSPNYHSDFKNSFQRWQLHVWDLHGPASTWNEQIEAEYRRQPVFAVVSGLVGGPWDPVARFCDAKHLPCVFPNTELPRTSQSGPGYSLYFSRGLELEAEALAGFLAANPNQPGLIVQIHTRDADGLVPAEAFARAAKAQIPGAQLRDLSVSGEQELCREVRRVTTSEHPPDVLVLWPGKYSAPVLAALSEAAPSVKSGKLKIVTLPAGALEVAQLHKPLVLPADLLFTYPYELPTVYYPRVFLVRQWMHSRKVDIVYPRLQFQTYYALTMLQFGLDQILDDFFRDYLVEVIEHEAESHLDNGTHPSLALGPGQRFASKGAYIVKLDAAAQDGFRAVSGWIVP
jgi:hypothetical protein